MPRLTSYLSTFFFVLASAFAPLCALVHAGPQAEVLPLSKSPIEDIATRTDAARPGAVRPLPRVAEQLIIAFEGWKPSPYDDPSGYCTVGYGHLIGKRSCESSDLFKFNRPLTPAEGKVLLESDTWSARSAIQRLVKRDLMEHEFGALTSFVFNIGKENFAKSTLLVLINQGNDELVTKEFRKWKVSNKRVLKGLEFRRACEAALFNNQVKLTSSGEFLRSECEQLGAAPDTDTLIDVETGEEVSFREVQ